jgi:hypothetical protein
LITPDAEAPGDEGWIPPWLGPRRIHDASGDLARALGVRAVPAVFFTDRDGMVRAVALGRQSEAETARRLRAIADPATFTTNP